MSEPHDAPPSYATATGASATPSRPTHLDVPRTRSGISPTRRRSMEDEIRKLPPGWVRQWDDKEHHQFFVDTKADPPRSIWHHPYDDDKYLSTLTAEQRERIQEEEKNLRKPNDHHMDTTDDEREHAPLPPRPDAGKNQDKNSSLGRKMKDKLTGTTHEQRKVERAQREEEERKYYELHLRFREALQRAQATGQPQIFAKDKDGKDVYVEPPSRTAYGGGYGYGGSGYGYNPYSSGVYSTPNARYIRPQMAYNRPYGPGYGGGYGLPLAGGLMGGMLLGGLLF